MSKRKMSRKYVRRHLYRVWACQVDSGYHNGAKCRPSEPHGAGWECGYAFKLFLWDTPRVRERLGISLESEDAS